MGLAAILLRLDRPSHRKYWDYLCIKEIWEPGVSWDEARRLMVNEVAYDPEWQEADSGQLIVMAKGMVSIITPSLALQKHLGEDN